ncbi:hypothetical protein T484DRAFT_1853933, partial [Baffinella frigidus]
MALALAPVPLAPRHHLRVITVSTLVLAAAGGVAWLGFRALQGITGVAWLRLQGAPLLLVVGVAWLGFRALQGAPLLLVVVTLSDFSIA